jgi:hypothetical protein
MHRRHRSCRAGLHGAAGGAGPRATLALRVLLVVALRVPRLMPP